LPIHPKGMMEVIMTVDLCHSMVENISGTSLQTLALIQLNLFPKLYGLSLTASAAILPISEILFSSKDNNGL
jgi:hypothetical protein